MRDKRIKVVSYILTTIIVAVILFAFYSLGQYLFIRFGYREVYSFAEAAFNGIGTSVGLILYQIYVDHKQTL